MISSKSTVDHFLSGVLLAYLVLGIEYSIAEENSADFAVDFKHEKTLSEEEINTVAELAYLAGIGEISLIKTVHMPPSRNYMILVREKPTDDGPYLKYRELSVGSEKFFFKDHQSQPRELSESRGGATIGGFWELGIRTVKFVSEEIDGEAVEVRVGEGVDYNDLMFILDSISNDQIEFYSHEVSRHSIWATRQLPSYIGLSEKGHPELEMMDYKLHYGQSGSTYYYYVYLEENRVVVFYGGFSVS